MRRPYVTIIFFCLTVLWAPLAQAADWSDTDPAVRTATDFIAILDQGGYDQAWAGTSTLFQALNSTAQWRQKQQTIRTAYGPISSRELRRIDYRSNYAFSPDGRYCIVQFNSSFPNKATTTETVVLSEHPDNRWLVREYVLR